MVGSTLSVNNIWHAYFSEEWLFWAWVGYHISLKQKSHTFTNWSVIFSRQMTENMIPEMGFPVGLVTLSAYGSIYSESGRLWNWKQNTLTLNTELETMGQPWFQLYLDTKSCGWELGKPIIVCSASFQKIMPHTSFQSVQTFCEWQMNWTFPLPVLWHNSIWCMHPSLFYLLAMTQSWLCLAFGSTLPMDFFSLLSQGSVLHLLSRSTLEYRNYAIQWQTAYSHFIIPIFQGHSQHDH